MYLVIHRGAKEIGGSCVEIKTDKTRILIDFGMPLVDAVHQPFDSRILRNKSAVDLKKAHVLPDIPGLYKDETKSINAILFSHSHPDHYGLLNHIHPDIPIYLSEGARVLIEISNLFTLVDGNSR
jgi:ribonuclease J